jgi:peptide/nickel transport system substrate-binding protein
MTEANKTSRRRFIQLSLAAGAAAALAACQTPAPTPTTAPAATAAATAAAKPTTAPAATSAPAATTAAQPTAAAKPTTAAAPAAGAATATPAQTGATVSGGIKQVARKDTLVVVRAGSEKSYFAEWDQWNAFVPTANHQFGVLLVLEPLAHYSAFADKWYMWLAESYKFSDDFKSLTVKMRDGITWSDGKPFTADDVTYTFTEAAKAKEKVRWGTNIALVMDKAETVDPLTTKFTFKVPSPRFFYMAAYHFDIGVYIIPKHIFQGQDISTFSHFDLAKGWPVTTAPWRVVASSRDQKVLDRADDWWGVKAGVGKLPEMKRILWLPDLGEQQLVQGIVKNDYDLTTGIQPTSFPTVLKGNPKATSWTGQDSPYGYVDWWPHSLYVNCEKAPWDDKNVRWALSYYIDRQKLVDVGWAGASAPTTLPMPSYPPLQPYFDAVKDLLTQYPTNAYDTKKGDELLTKKGWKKNAQGMWQDEKGQPVKLELISFFDFTSVGPVIVELLKRAGVDASYSEPPDFGTRIGAGNFTGMLFGHGGSCREPAETMQLYQSVSEAIPGGHLVNYSHWKNSEWDKLTDQALMTSPEDTAKLLEIWKKGMAIWIPELPDIPIEHGFHRLPLQETYWTNWPSAKNPYVNTAQWHLTFPIVVHTLKAAGA